MKSYEAIKEIADRLYIGINDENEVVDRIEKSLDKVQAHISSDFYKIFNIELKMEGHLIYVDDPTYRQSATGLILNGSSIDDDCFKIRVECLIDIGRIWLKVINNSSKPEFIKIENRIKAKMNSEGLAELKELK